MPAPNTPIVLWFTGLSGAGKTTLATTVQRELQSRGVVCLLLDGDTLRQGLSRDLSFTPTDRTENIRRTTEVAHLAFTQGYTVLVSLISPYQSDRALARDRFPIGSFYEIHIDCPLPICAERDPKGLYAQAQRGELTEFTGISAPYDLPINPEIRLNTATQTVKECVAEILAKISLK
jgi:adenylyl-sulfate kinase